MSHFGNKTSTTHYAFQKMNQSAHAFGQKNNSHMFRKMNHTLNDISNIASPILSVGSVVPSQFAPAARILNATLGGAKALTSSKAQQENRQNSKINFVDSENHVIRKPQLER